MNQTALNLTALTIFTLVMLSLLGPLLNLSPVVPAIATAGILGLGLVDTLGWQGQGANLLLDWVTRLTRGISYEQRVLHHEAGHFLVAYRLNIPVTGYALNAWEAFRQGHPGQGGVQFSTDLLEADLAQGSLSLQLLDRYCTLWMAGIAAEMLVYGNAIGGTDDRQKLQILWLQMQRPLTDCAQKQRWAMLQAKTLLQENQAAYQALVMAMGERQSIESIQALLEEQLDKSQ